DLSAAEEFAPDFVEAAPEITEIQEDIQTEETVQQTDNGKPNVDASDFPDNGKPNVDASDFPDGDVSIQPIKKTECGCKMTGSGIINPGEIAAVLFFLTVILFMRKRVSSQ
ncbi:MAG: hypothetical protein FJ088_14545, partial [Deltaproteobacteria bacterium]|nr:hypothetical protein [Deltaproteobacteria bacterium]